MEKRNIFKIKSIAIILATLCAVGWAMAFPLIKVGFSAFSIAESDTAGKTLFAGIRFFIAGLVVIATALFMGRSFRIKGTKDKLLLLLFGVVNTTLHYFFFYMGVSRLSGSRSAILNALGSFLLIVLASMFFKDDKFNASKLLGCILGLAGIIIINLNGSGDLFSDISLMGDGMLIACAVCSAFGGILTRVVSKRVDIIVATGISLTVGGALLLLAGVIMGGRITHISFLGAAVLLILIFISAFCFGIYNQLLCYNPVSHIAIFNALIPVLGVVFSCIILGEPFMAKYIIAGIIVATGIFVINKKRS